MFVVAVRFIVKAAFVAEFKRAIMINAAASLRDEEGCHRFDVCFADEGRKCFLYELYSDPSSFDHHRATEHFKRFNSLTTEMINDKRLETYVLEENSASPSAF